MCWLDTTATPTTHALRVILHDGSCGNHFHEQCPTGSSPPLSSPAPSSKARESHGLLRPQACGQWPPLLPGRRRQSHCSSAPLGLAMPRAPGPQAGRAVTSTRVPARPPSISRWRVPQSVFCWELREGVWTAQHSQHSREPNVKSRAHLSTKTGPRASLAASHVPKAGERKEWCAPGPSRAGRPAARACRAQPRERL